MRSLSSHVPFSLERQLDDLEIAAPEKEKVKSIVRKAVDDYIKIIDVVFRLLAGISIIFIFYLSYKYSFALIDKVMSVEVDLLSKKILNPENRSINATTVSALIAATSAQAGIGFYLLAKHLFPTDSKLNG